MHLRALSTGAPHSNGFSVGLQALRLRQGYDRRSHALQPCAGELLHGNDFYKILDAQPATKTSGSAGGKNMIRTRGVVACGLR